MDTINSVTVNYMVPTEGWKKDGTAMLRLRFTFKRQGRYLKTNIIARRKSLGNWLCGNRIVQRI